MEGSADIAALTFLSFFGIFWMLIICILIVVAVLNIWLFIACTVDVAKKDEKEFKDKTTWLIILILTFIFGFSLISSLIYYFMYKPKLRFWEK